MIYSRKLHFLHVSKKKRNLIDQIFCKFSKHENRNKSGILLKKISDHLPCFTTINIKNKSEIQPKYVKIRDTGQQAMEEFRSEIAENISKCNFNHDSNTDPNNNYVILENIIKSAHDKCFPLKEVRFNKYKHKIAPWICHSGHM